MENLLKLKTALITGATQGIGKAIAIKLVSTGHSVYLTSSNPKNLKILEADLRKINSQAIIQTLAADVSTPDGIKELKVWAKALDPDILVNNVGLFEPYSLLGEADGLFEKLLSVNYLTAHQLCRTVGSLMKAKKRGYIFNISSTASRNPVPAASYTVTKFAIRGLTYVLREELREHGVKVTEVIPGSTWTSSWTGTTIPESSFVNVEDIAEAIYNCLLLSSCAHVEELVITPAKGNVLTDPLV